MIQLAGFGNVEFVDKTGFNSSPNTEGVLILAKKPSSLDIQKEEKTKKSTPLHTQPAEVLQTHPKGKNNSQGCV